MAKMALKGEGKFNLSPIINFLKGEVFQGIAIGIVTYILIFGMMILALSPKQYDLDVGDIVDEPIKAPRDVEDKMLTEAKLEQAISKVPSVYRLDQQATDDAIREVYNMFDSIQMVRYKVDQRQKAIVAQMRKEIEESRAEEGSGDGDGENQEPDQDIEEVEIEEPDKLEILDDKFLDELGEELPIKLSKEEIIACVLADHSELEFLQEELVKLIESILQAGIKQENIYEAKDTLRESVRGLTISNELKTLGGNIGSNVMTANMLYDHVATEAEKEKVAAMVERVIYKKGQYIVQAGEPITENQLEVLKELGIIKDNAADIWLTIGAGLVVFIMLLITALYLIYFDEEIAKSPRDLLIISTVILSVLIICYAISHINPYMMPVAMAGMLLAMILKPELAAIINILVAILISMILEGNLGVAVMSLCGGMAGIYILSKPQQRNTIVVAGVGAGLVNALSIIGVDLMGTAMRRATLSTALYGFGGGILSGVLTVGILPIWENLFKVITPLRLVELSNPNQPALKRLLMEAPGTYHHSVLVANLAESAADSIGADDLLARVGAYYHDLGKLKRPYFFKENQLSRDNPHDKLNPTLSTYVITMHVKDGIDIAKEYKIPEKIQAFIVEHHGTTAVRYFYHKAKQQDEGVCLEDFRYSGPKPQTAETAIVMMADTVEAAVRALPEPTPDKIEKLVRKLIKEKLDDGQFDECPITLSNLNTIANTFTAVVTGIVHDRIQYPDIDIANEEGVKDVD